MGRSLLIRDRELESSDILLGRVGVFSGSLEAVECPFKNEIRSGPLLDMLVLVLYLGVPPIYGHILFCSSFLPVYVHLVQILGFNNIFTVKKNII
jgi:hypothetical protein